MLLNMNVVQRKKLTQWEQVNYMSRLVTQDLSHRKDPTGEKYFFRTYFGRFLILGGFRWINGLRPTGIKQKELSDENIFTVQLVNMALREWHKIKEQCQMYSYLAYDFQFTRYHLDIAFDEEEIFFLKSLGETLKIIDDNRLLEPSFTLNNVQYSIARLLVLGAKYQYAHGGYAFNHQHEIEADRKRTCELVNLYLNKIFDRKDFNPPFDKEVFELFTDVTIRPLAHL